MSPPGEVGRGSGSEGVVAAVVVCGEVVLEAVVVERDGEPAVDGVVEGSVGDVEEIGVPAEARPAWSTESKRSAGWQATATAAIERMAVSAATNLFLKALIPPRKHADAGPILADPVVGERLIPDGHPGIGGLCRILSRPFGPPWSVLHLCVVVALATEVGQLPDSIAWLEFWLQRRSPKVGSTCCGPRATRSTSSST